MVETTTQQAPRKWAPIREAEGKLALNETALLEPLRRRKPTTYFVNSMGDLFHEDVPDEWIDRLFAVMALCPQHTFQILTKRSDRMLGYLEGWNCIGGQRKRKALIVAEKQELLGRPQNIIGDWPLPNVWLGVSVEDQRAADERVPDLLATPAAVHWLSCEPLLGPVDLTKPFYQHSTGYEMQGYLRDKAEHDDFRYWAEKLEWIVVGGESGKDARPMHPDWARSLRDQCHAAGVPFFFKQWGEWSAVEIADDGSLNPPAPMGKGVKGGDMMKWRRWEGDQPRPPHPGEKVNTWFAPGTFALPVGKKAAGRLLDGVLHDAMPGQGA